MQAVGPNEHCPCGSGRKYKKCHGRAAAGAGQALWPWVLGALLLVLGAAVAVSFSGPGAPQVAPPGSAAGAPARIGQPWEYDKASNTHFDPSPGHNHWHSGPPPAGR